MESNENEDWLTYTPEGDPIINLHTEQLERNKLEYKQLNDEYALLNKELDSLKRFSISLTEDNKKFEQEIGYYQTTVLTLGLLVIIILVVKTILRTLKNKS